MKGLDYLQISVYDGPKTKKNLKSYLDKIISTSSKFKIRPRYLPPEENFGLNLSNRGGTMENAEFSIPSLEEARERPCYYPHYLFYGLSRGRYFMSHDWGKNLWLAT